MYVMALGVSPQALSVVSPHEGKIRSSLALCVQRLGL